jgi:hypothetical protein
MSTCQFALFDCSMSELSYKVMSVAEQSRDIKKPGESPAYAEKLLLQIEVGDVCGDGVDETVYAL